MVNETMIAAIRERFIHFVEETRGTSPLYAFLSGEIAEDGALLEVMRKAPPEQRRANLLFAAVHYLLLRERNHPLKEYYASLEERPRPPDRGAFDAFREFCLKWKSELEEIIGSRHTQTNEVRRTSAFLPVLQELSERVSIGVVEIGASGGLNLLTDCYAYRYGDGPWMGDRESPVRIHCSLRASMPPVRRAPPMIAFRIGLDSSPLHVSEEDDAMWLKACIWPEHEERRSLLAAAIDVARLHPPTLMEGDALEDLDRVVNTVPKDLPVCLFHSATLTYLPIERRKEFATSLDRLAAKRELYWLSLEGSGVRPFEGEPWQPSGGIEEGEAVNAGELILGSWSDGVRQDRRLAVVDMHGRWIAWDSGGWSEIPNRQTGAQQL